MGNIECELSPLWFACLNDDAGSAPKAAKDKIRSLFGTVFGIQFFWNRDLLHIQRQIVGRLQHDFLVENCYDKDS